MVLWVWSSLEWVGTSVIEVCAVQTLNAGHLRIVGCRFLSDGEEKEAQPF